MKTILLLSLMLVLCGCGPSARYVLKDGSEGIIAMPRPTEDNRLQAHQMMSEHFPAGYSIVREEEVPVGLTTHVHKHESGSRSITTRDRTEYRIHYVGHQQTEGSLESAGQDNG